MTNGRTLTLASVDGSGFTVDAGTADTYLSVVGGDLLQQGTTWLYNGSGTFASSGHIGLPYAPIYVMGTDPPYVAQIGKPRSEEHTSELQALMRRSYAVFC